MSRAMMLQLLTVARRHSHAAFRIQIDGINAAKHLFVPIIIGYVSLVEGETSTNSHQSTKISTFRHKETL
jgi:uncharacterized membrane protein